MAFESFSRGKQPRNDFGSHFGVFGALFGPPNSLMLAFCFVLKTSKPLETSRKKGPFARACLHASKTLNMKINIAR